MNSSKVAGKWSLEKSFVCDVPRVSSLSDVLYLISSQHFSGLPSEILQKLDDSKICFIRGRSRSALRSIDEALSVLDESKAAYRDVLAYRLLVATMAGLEVHPLRTDADLGSAAKPDALSVMNLCLEANERWYTGDLIQGLWLNQSAVQHARDTAPMWRLYADFFLAKKLIDIHVSYQAARVIQDMRDLVKSAGLLAFGSVPEALEAMLHWQTGQVDEAVRSARLAMRLSKQHASVFGVKTALSVSAMVHLSRGEWDQAAETLGSFHASNGAYASADSVSRAEFVEAALVYLREGPRSAAERIRAQWHLLGTGSGYFVEDLGRPAWLVAVARQADDSALAECSLRGIERLAQNNHSIALLDVAANHARTAMASEQPEVWSALPFGVGHLVPAASKALPAWPRQAAPESGPVGSPRRTAPPAQPEEGPGHAPADPGGDTAHQPASLASLTLRESEIARLVGQGMTNQQVAQRLGLSPHTVNFHLRNVFRKLEISTRVKLGSIVAEIERGRAR